MDILKFYDCLGIGVKEKLEFPITNAKIGSYGITKTDLRYIGKYPLKSLGRGFSRSIDRFSLEDYCLEAGFIFASSFNKKREWIRFIPLNDVHEAISSYFLLSKEKDGRCWFCSNMLLYHEDFEICVEEFEAIKNHLIKLSNPDCEYDLTELHQWLHESENPELKKVASQWNDVLKKKPTDFSTYRFQLEMFAKKQYK
ncbi:MAG: hypothetical protein FWE14_08065 [Lachnospiraceae bacterium]|nr:hypothetical protein [Lachnospiraceae bacterium]